MSDSNLFRSCSRELFSIVLATDLSEFVFLLGKFSGVTDCSREGALCKGMRAMELMALKLLGLLLMKRGRCLFELV